MASAWVQDAGCIVSTLVAMATLAFTVVGYTRSDKDTISAAPSICPPPSPGPSLSTFSPSLPIPPPPANSSNAKLQNAGLAVSTVLAIASLAIAIAEYATPGDSSILESPSPSFPYSSTLPPSFPSPPRSPSPSPSILTPTPSASPSVPSANPAVPSTPPSPPPSSLLYPSLAPAASLGPTPSPTLSAPPPITTTVAPVIPAFITPYPSPCYLCWRYTPHPVYPATLAPPFPDAPHTSPIATSKAPEELSSPPSSAPFATEVPEEPSLYPLTSSYSSYSSTASHPTSYISTPAPLISSSPPSTTIPSYQAIEFVGGSDMRSGDGPDWLASGFLLASIIFSLISVLLWRTKSRHSQGGEQEREHVEV